MTTLVKLSALNYIDGAWVESTSHESARDVNPARSSESLGDDIGFYKDPYQKYGNLSWEMLRACRLVVDTGIHAFGWTRQRAIDYIGGSRENAEREVERYMAWPGQALGYKIGQLKILSLRRKAEAALGASFDLRDFHDAVLEEGGMPLSVLEAKMERWIAGRRR